MKQASGLVCGEPTERNELDGHRWIFAGDVKWNEVCKFKATKNLNVNLYLVRTKFQKKFNWRIFKSKISVRKLIEQLKIVNKSTQKMLPKQLYYKIAKNDEK